MEEALELGQVKLTDYLACPRRFQLRYVEQIAWPVARKDPSKDRSRIAGQQFHTLLHRHFLGIPTGDEELDDMELRQWWQLFRQFEHRLAVGRRQPELSLTIPIGGLMLSGRFDLLVDNVDDITIYDWKTFGRVKSSEQLREELQSRIYLALVAESGRALGRAPGRSVRPEQVTLIYWFLSDPPVEVALPYSTAAHAENWRYFSVLAGEIEGGLLTRDTWPLTDNLQECARCAYQILCGRTCPDSEFSGSDLSEWEDLQADSPLEPAAP